MAIRGDFTSPFHDEPWIESHLDIRDKDGNHLPGYGWIFPVGDGTVNVGVGLLSTFAGWKYVNTTHLMEAFCETAPARWGISPETATCAPTGGRLPTGGSVLPRVGPTFVVVRRRGGLRQSVQRRGHLGRVRDRPARRRRGRPRARDRRRPRARDLPTRGSPRSTASTSRSLGLFVRAIGNPAVMRELTRVGMHSRTLMEWVLRIMANLLRPDEIGPAEAAYRAVAALVRVAPEP